MKKEYRSHCPINFSQEIFGDKWSLLIIRDIMFKGKRYYGEFLNSEEKISTNILADRLEKLEDNKIIIKVSDVNNLSKFIYTLTDKGIDLLPLLLEMIVWGAKHDKQTKAPPEFINRFISDKESLILEIKKNLHFD
ncbi:MAG: transcriptional regulator [Planctomycetota bacterium]|nr:MAG: transcriptional regulator [Planctomycetota bacterium]